MPDPATSSGKTGSEQPTVQRDCALARHGGSGAVGGYKLQGLNCIRHRQADCRSTSMETTRRLQLKCFPSSKLNRAISVSYRSLLGSKRRFLAIAAFVLARWPRWHDRKACALPPSQKESAKLHGMRVSRWDSAGRMPESAARSCRPRCSCRWHSRAGRRARLRWQNGCRRAVPMLDRFPRATRR